MPELNDEHFTDILEKRRELEYLYEYGVASSAEKMPKLLCGKQEQTIKGLYNLLGEQGNWDSVAKKEFGGNTSRQIIKSNHYQTNKGSWAPIVFGSYGIGNVYLSSGKKSVDYFDGWQESFKTSYPWTQDVKVEMDSLKAEKRVDSIWTREQCGRLKEGEYDSFLEMLAFFSEWTPLGILGFHFLRRLDVPLTCQSIFVRKVHVNDAIEQEIIFRCLYAIETGRKIQYEKKIYTPIRLFYRDNSFEERAIHLYLYVQDADGSYRELSLSQGEQVRIVDKKEERCPIQVEFYQDTENTSYLNIRREKSIWAEYECGSHMGKGKKEIFSPYYPNVKKWSVRNVTYKIPEKYEQAFREFIHSFGEFAKILEKKTVLADESGFKVWEKGCENSLCNAYNSSFLLEWAKREQVVLPPTLTEIAWIRFVLETYPNFVWVFIEDDTRKKVLTKIKVEYGERLPQLFDLRCFDWKTRWVDMDESAVILSNKLLKVMREKKIVICEYDSKEGRRQDVALIPYAFEYDELKYSVNMETGMWKVMAYDLEQKRNVILRLSDFALALNGSDENNHLEDRTRPFSIWEKMYHICACRVRMDALEAVSVWEDALCQVLKEEISEKAGENFSSKSLKKAFEQYSKGEIIGIWKNILEYYLDDNGNVGENSKSIVEYYKKVAVYFLQVCEELQNDASKRNIWTKIPDNYIWRLIDGEFLEGKDAKGNKISVANEIVYFNESLKSKTLSFEFKKELNQGTDGMYDAGTQSWAKKIFPMIYRLFHSYVCKGVISKENRLRFTVEYESFAFRDIHMRMMLLANSGEGLDLGRIEPEEDKNILMERFASQKGLKRVEIVFRRKGRTWGTVCDEVNTRFPFHTINGKKVSVFYEEKKEKRGFLNRLEKFLFGKMEDTYVLNHVKTVEPTEILGELMKGGKIRCVSSCSFAGKKKELEEFQKSYFCRKTSASLYNIYVARGEMEKLKNELRDSEISRIWL